MTPDSKKNQQQQNREKTKSEPPKKIISYAFIDANNLILGLKNSQIKLDYKKHLICQNIYASITFKKHF